MPKFNTTVQHRLAPDDAVRRIKTLLGEVKTQHADKIRDLHEEWDGAIGKFRFSIMGNAVSGTLAVTASQVEISGNLPFAALLFKGKIEATIKDHLEKRLA